MSRPEPRVDKPNVALRRRPSDFSGRGPMVPQFATCCCCCCLHWAGATVGGAAGVVLAWRAEKRKPGPPVHPTARAYVLRATWLGVIGTAALIGGALFWGQETSGWIQGMLEAILVALAVVPSLASLPIGAAAMLGAALARRKARVVSDPDERKRMTAGMGLAWRIAWRSFVWATFGSGVGWLVMYLYGLIVAAVS